MYSVLKGKELRDILQSLKMMDRRFIWEEDGKYFILKEGNSILAYALVEEEEKGYIIKRIVVEKSRRYQSYGSKLINFIINYTLKSGKDAVITKDINKEEFFLKNGFKKDDKSLVLNGIQEKNERLKEGVKGTCVSMAANIILALLKIVVGSFGRSRALIADGFHSISDVIGSIVVLFSIYLGSVPEDEEHPYGHEKVESIAGNIIGVLLVLTAFDLIRDSLGALFKQKEFITPSKVTIFIALFSVVLKYSMYRYKKNIGIRIKNDAILADAREHRSDAVSSLGVLIGLVLAIFINPVFDIYISILVSLFIGKEGIHIIFETSNSILDSQDKEFVRKVKNYAYENSNISNIHDILMRTSGHKVFISFHMRVPKEMSVYEAHNLSDDIRYSMLSKFDELRDVTIHLDCIID